MGTTPWYKHRDISWWYKYIIFTKHSSSSSHILAGPFLGILAKLNSYWSQRTGLNGSQSPLPHSCKKIHNNFLDFLHETGLTQVNKLITRLRSQNILDIICTSYPNIISNIRTESGISDHDILMFDLNVKPKRQNKPSCKIYNFNKADSDNFKSMLREECDRFYKAIQNWD